MNTRISIHGQWSSQLTFILAATGSAVGLGNVWRFPYIVGENGGGAFVLLYLACILLLGLPIMMAEILLGRRGRQSPINTMLSLAREEGRSPAWSVMGWGGVITGFLILSFYSVVAGWTLAYVFRAAGGMFSGLDAEGSAALFSGLLASPEALLAWHTIFIVMVAVVVARGVRSGLERAVTVLMPALVVLLLLLVGYSLATGDFIAGLQFLLYPDWSELTAGSVLVALGQAFFTLSLGMGAIMVYGSYLRSDASIARTSTTVVLSDTAVALLAGLAIFPILLGSGLAPAQGPGLIFITLPIAFAEMPLGAFFGALFFLLLVLAAWTSAISLVEPAVSFLVENLGHSRVFAASVVAFAAWLLGIAALLSLNVWSGHTLFGKGVLDLLDYLTANILLPLGGMLIALFVGWRMRAASLRDELRLDGWPFALWHGLVRYVAPIAVLLVFLNAIGVL
jgi:neurotransmitter:Na+ symporter, NSS family